MKKRTKKYKPREVVLNPLNYFLGGLKKVDDEHLTELNVKNHLALVNMLQGNGTREDWDKLCGMVNMALVLTEQHFDRQYLDMLYKARDAIKEIGRRMIKIHSFVLKGEEKTAIENALEVHEAQLTALRVIDIERATDEVYRRVKYHINTEKVMVK